MIKPCFESGLRLPVEHIFCFINVCGGVPHVGGMSVFPNNFRLLADTILHHVNEFDQFDWLFSAAKIKDFVTDRFCSENGAMGDIVDVSKVAGLFPVAINRDRESPPRSI